VSNKGSNQRGGNGGEGDGEKHRRPQRQCDSRDDYSYCPLVEHEVPLLPEGLAYHEGRSPPRRGRSLQEAI